MYYQAVVAFETGVLDGEGQSKVKKYKYVVESESVFEATTRLSHYLVEDARTSEIISVINSGQF